MSAVSVAVEQAFTKDKDGNLMEKRQGRNSKMLQENSHIVLKWFLRCFYVVVIFVRAFETRF